ncbi:MAG: dienelactone hydrolase family protein [Variibacter sp.]|nr:dienelactone hydrolase family protein [Variibacter sp.]
MRSPSRREVLRAGAGILGVGALAALVPAAPALAETPARRVTFPSADGRTTLVGYLFAPLRAPAAPTPAVVMMHGRAGAYSSLAHGVYDAQTLSMRHRAWGALWAQRGVLAVLVDGFGPRGHPQGFPRFSYDSRPAALNEVTVRPLDAYGALAWLRARADVAGDRIGLMGWSNGGSATIASMAGDGRFGPRNAEEGFRAAVAFYPACGLKGEFDHGYRPYAPLMVLHGSADEEVSPTRCSAFAQRSRRAGGEVEFWLYPGATHGFDDPGRRRQGVAANAGATRDAIARTQAFFSRHLQI